MEAITRQQAADRLCVPVAWIDAMVEAGELRCHEGFGGAVLIDAEDVDHLRDPEDKRPAPSLSHVRSMLRRVMGGPDKVEQSR